MRRLAGHPRDGPEEADLGERRREREAAGEEWMKMAPRVFAQCALLLLATTLATTLAQQVDEEARMSLKEEAQHQADTGRFTSEEPENVGHAPLLRQPRGVRGGGSLTALQGPRFALEPPALVEYSNSTGAVVGCRAADPSAAATTGIKPTLPDTPTMVSWRRMRRVPSGLDELEAEEEQLEELEEPVAESSLRADGSLVLEPRPEPSAEWTSYRCCLSNRHGQLCSRPVRTRAVADAQLKLEVFDELALAGNSAALRCRTRGGAQHQLARHLELVGWLRDERLVVSSQGQQATLASQQYGSNLQRARRLLNGAQQAPKYLMLATGELLVVNASRSDAGLYKCRVRHRLTNQLITSESPGGRLVVDESRSRVDLRETGHTPLIVSRENEQSLLCAQLQSSPQATRLLWSWEPPEGGGPRPLAPNAADPHLHQPTPTCLLISHTQMRHAGRYTCEATNGHSSLKSTPIRLVVASQQLGASITMLPSQTTATVRVQVPTQQTQVVQFGQVVHLNCSIWGQPYDTVAWLRDGRFLAVSSTKTGGARRRRSSPKANFKLLQPHVIAIESFNLAHRGLYQCLAYSSTTAATTFELPPTPEESSLSSDFLLGQLERDHFRAASGHLQLELQLAKAQIQRPPLAQSAHQGDRLSLECSASGLPAPRILWLLDEQLIQQGSTSDAGQRLEAQEWPPLELGDEPSSRQALEWLLWSLGDSGDMLALMTEGADEQLEWQLLRNSLRQVIGDERFQVEQRQMQQQETLPLVTSQLNVSQLSPSESGHFRCLAINPMGGQLARAQINVISSPPRLQRRAYAPRNLTLLAGQQARLQCPIAGFPLGRVEWLRNGRRLPSNHRQRLEPVRWGHGGHLELFNVDSKIDTGAYTCRAWLGSGKSGTEQTETNSTNEEQVEEDSVLEAQVEVETRLGPMIDGQSLPELVQTNEGMRTKLVCSVVQGDQPMEIRWLRRLPGGLSSAKPQKPKVVQVGRFRLQGLQLVENLDLESGNNQQEEQVTIHNLEDSSLLTFKRVQKWDAGDYLCLAQNEWSSVGRWTRLQVNVAPAWALEPPTQVSAPLGSRLQLDCSAYGQPQPAGQWKRLKSSQQHSDQPPNQEHSQELAVVSNYRQRAYSNGSLVIDQLEITDAGQFMCELTNGIGSGLSKVVELQVQVAPQFKQRHSTHLGQLNSRTQLACQVQGDQPMVVGWRRGDDVIDLVKDTRHRLVGERSLNAQSYESILSIDHLLRNDSGQYVCVASNEFGTQEAYIHLVVQEPPESPQLMRPIRATSRQATVSFRPPFSGNSPIRRYELSYATLSGQPEETNLTNSSLINHQPLSWLQVLLEAPPQPTMADMIDSPSNNLTATSQLVSLNLCCLQPYTRYAIQVKSINDIGTSGPSKLVQFVTDEEAIGGPPLDVGVEATGAHSLKVRWRPPARHLQNGLVRGYYIGYKTLVSPSLDAPMAPIRAAAPGNSQLPPGVKVFEASGDGGEQYQYKNVQLDLSPNALFFAPFKSLHQDLHQDSAQELHLLHLQNQTNKLVSSNQVLTSYLTNLRRKTAYSIIVQAYNQRGAGPRSDQVQVSTLDAAPPMSPLLRIVSVSHQSALITWTGRRFSQSRPNNGTKLGQRLSALDEIEAGGHGEGAQEEDDDPQAYYTINFRVEPLPAQDGRLAQVEQAVEWQQRRLQRRQAQPYALDGLRCGSQHSAFMTATNSLGQSEPGEAVKFTTMGAAPLAPSNSRDFLQVNATFVVLRLSAWHNSGCPISSFLLKYRPQNQLKWTILEHQLVPTQQTVTVSGSAVFSTRSPGPTLTETGSLNSQEKNSALRQQLLHDFVIRNLQAGASYRLLAEATSEAGNTEAEYELETGNFTTSTLTIHVNGLAANEANLNRSPQDIQPADLSNMDDFSGYGGNRGAAGGQVQPTQGGATFQRYTLGVWSLTILFVVASVFMASTALVLGFRSVLRVKPHSNSNGNHQRQQSAAAAAGDNLLTTLLCCSGSSSSASSLGADSSHSSSAGTCYQLPVEHPLEAYGCALIQPNHQQQDQSSPSHRQQQHARTISDADYRLEEQTNANGPNMLRHLVSSSSLSTIGGQANAAAAHLTQRQALTLGRFNGGGGGDTAANIRNHYASTLGKQHSSFLQQQPLRYNLPTNDNIYGRLHQHQKDGNDTTMEQQAYHLFHATQPPMSSSSGYETGASARMDGTGNELLQTQDLHYSLAPELDLYQMNVYGASSAANVAESNLFEQSYDQNHFSHFNEVEQRKLGAATEQQLAVGAYGLIFGNATNQTHEQEQHQLQLLAATAASSHSAPSN